MAAAEVNTTLKLSLISEATVGMDYPQSVEFINRLVGALIVDVPAHVLIGAISIAQRTMCTRAVIQ